MKKYYVFLITVLIVGCMVNVKYPEPTISNDGKSVTYQAMHLLKPVQANYDYWPTRKAFLPPQKLKIYLTDFEWTYYKAKVSLPEFPFGCGLAIKNKGRSGAETGFWINKGSVMGQIPIIQYTVTGIEFELIEFTEEV